MSVVSVVQIGHPALKRTNKSITSYKSPYLTSLIQDLKDTMYHNDLIGIAAPQIAKNYQVFITHPRKTKARSKNKGDILRVYINPKIISYSKQESIIYEGCGSVGKGTIFGPVKRPHEITIQAYNEKGKQFYLTTDGILARVIQHEFDHLNGIEFTEKLTHSKKLIDREFYIKTIKNSSSQKKWSTITKIIVGE